MHFRNESRPCATGYYGNVEKRLARRKQYALSKGCYVDDYECSIQCQKALSIGHYISHRSHSTTPFDSMCTQHRSKTTKKRDKFTIKGKPTLCREPRVFGRAVRIEPSACFVPLLVQLTVVVRSIALIRTISAHQIGSANLAEFMTR
jgi:hypothetical protein